MSRVWICLELVFFTNWLIMQKGDSWVKPERNLWTSGRDKRFSSRDGRDSACNNCCCGPLPVKALQGGDREKHTTHHHGGCFGSGFKHRVRYDWWTPPLSNEVAAGFCSRSWTASVDTRKDERSKIEMEMEQNSWKINSSLKEHERAILKRQQQSQWFRDKFDLPTQLNGGKWQDPDVQKQLSYTHTHTHTAL